MADVRISEACSTLSCRFGLTRIHTDFEAVAAARGVTHICMRVHLRMDMVSIIGRPRVHVDAPFSLLDTGGCWRH